MADIAEVDAERVREAYMDGAWLGSIDISMKKARTARFFDRPQATDLPPRPVPRPGPLEES